MNKTEFLASYSTMKPQAWIKQITGNGMFDSEYKWCSVSFTGKVVCDIDGTVLAAQITAKDVIRPLKHVTTKNGWFGVKHKTTWTYEPHTITEFVKVEDIRFVHSPDKSVS